MAHPHQPYWLWTGSISFALSLALVGVAGAFDASRTHFAFWTSAAMIGAYFGIGVAFICIVCAIREIRFPFAVEKSQRQDMREVNPASGTMPVISTAGGATTSGITQSVIEKRIFIEETPKELVRIYRTHTSAQAQRLLAPYYDQWLRVAGPLGDVGEWHGFFSQVVFRASPFTGPTVFMMFRDKDVFDKRLSVMRPGTFITVVGQIERIDQISVQINNCELESAGRK